MHVLLVTREREHQHRALCSDCGARPLLETRNSPARSSVARPRLTFVRLFRSRVRDIAGQSRDAPTCCAPRRTGTHEAGGLSPGSLGEIRTARGSRLSNLFWGAAGAPRPRRPKGVPQSRRTDPKGLSLRPVSNTAVVSGALAVLARALVAT